MNLFNRIWAAASVALVMVFPGVASAMPVSGDYDAVNSPRQQVQVLRARLQSLEAQKRNLESELLRLQEAQRENERASRFDAREVPGLGLSAGSRAASCPRPEGGQAGGLCAAPDMMQGMMQGMMQMMGQMMRAFVQ